MDMHLQMTYVLLMVLGVLAHFCKDMMKLKAEGLLMTPIKYWRSNPYQSILSIIGVVVFYIMAENELTKLTAFGAGYMCNSLADIIGDRAMGKIKQ